MIPDLFTQDPYGGHAGYRYGSPTSRDAAKYVTPGREQAYRDILSLLKLCPMTPDELAEHFGWNILYVRPRCTELRKMHKIEPTGERRANSTRCSAEVLRVKA